MHKGETGCNYGARDARRDRPFQLMGLLTILKKVKQKEKEVRLLILGLDNAGKSSILKKFNGEDISTIEPTLGFNIKTLEYLGFVLNCWDVGGQQTIRSYWRNYFEQTDGLIWVVDSADRWRMEDCKRELHKLLGQEVICFKPNSGASRLRSDRAQKLAGASLLIFANKQDLQGALTAAEIAEALDLANDAVTSSRHWEIRGCSAVTGAGKRFFTALQVLPFSNQWSCQGSLRESTGW